MKSWKETVKDIKLDFKFFNHKSNFKGFIITLFFDLTFQMLLQYRLFHYFSQWRGLGFLALPLIYSQKIFTGCYIHPGVELGHKINFPHPTGIVIGQNTKIGNGVTIFQGVTLGCVGKPNSPQCDYPIIEDNAIIYANAIIIGGIHVGKNSIVGAGSVVLIDVPSDVIVAGNPAHLIRKLE